MLEIKVEGLSASIIFKAKFEYLNKAPEQNFKYYPITF
jgi:hypothetical protein